MVEVAQPFALLSLTLFDRLFERSTFVTGWLVEGTVDTAVLASALDRVTKKWRMLAARVESFQEKDKTKWCLRIPLDEIPEDYPTFKLTTSEAEHPLSHYLTLPLGIDSPSLPHTFFLHPSTPRHYRAWQATQSPITCWHVTHCPPDPQNENKTFSCIGFARSHGIFDGVGAAAVMRALVAELAHEKWPIPPFPPAGWNENPVMKALDPELQLRTSKQKEFSDSGGFTVLGVTGAIRLAAWHLREKWWNGAQRRIILLPPAALTLLVDTTREELKKDRQDQIAISTGDILVAWMMKTVYSSGTPPTRVIYCSNVASFRSVLSSPSNQLTEYPHNAWVPLPYPVFSVQDLNRLSISQIAKRLAQSREALSIFDVISAYKTMDQFALSAPGHPDADETFLVSNVSASRILETDWSKAGSRGTICSYRYSITPTELPLANAAYISGRLSDGRVVLDVTFSKPRLALLLKETERLIAEAGI